MKTIGWIIDVPGWAYDGRAKQVACCLPQYVHRFIYYPTQGFLPLLGVDLIVCPDPRILPYFRAHSRVVLNLNAIKLFVRNLHGTVTASHWEK